MTLETGGSVAGVCGTRIDAGMDVNVWIDHGIELDIETDPGIDVDMGSDAGIEPDIGRDAGTDAGIRILSCRKESCTRSTSGLCHIVVVQVDWETTLRDKESWGSEVPGTKISEMPILDLFGGGDVSFSA